ncbi:MAG TPA: PspC domain-containing protein [Bryobacteraceae bacterium]|nr:PspC domain-containing protein [Bryobacteraceae bacterium]
MYCTRCGLDLREEDRFCSRCGNRTPVGTTLNGPLETYRPLMLDKRNKKIAGVCAGFARYIGVDTVLVRVIWLGMALCTGIGFLLYIAAWIVVPSDGGYEPQMTTHLPQTV